jgi:alpha-L-glutamate ligase-like protein
MRRWLARVRGLFSAGGVLGINRRNAGCILDHNPRSRFPVVDDKLLMADLCARVGVPTPAIIGVVARYAELPFLEQLLRFRTELVLKPARGSGGRGILVLNGGAGGRFRKPNGRVIDADGVRQHAADILAGMFSLGGRTDRVIVQELVRPHAAFADLAPRGAPDVRLVLYRFEPAMAMLRLPTLESNGRANLHQGGIGVGVDLTTGVTTHAIRAGSSIEKHPDTGAPLLGRTLPRWGELVDLARRAARAVGLGFVGMDVVLDGERGLLLLEANARPGLAIQLANGKGLLERIEEIDREMTR